MSVQPTRCRQQMRRQAATAGTTLGVCYGNTAHDELSRWDELDRCCKYGFRQDWDESEPQHARCAALAQRDEEPESHENDASRQQQRISGDSDL